MKFSRRRFVKVLIFSTATSLVAGEFCQRDLLAFCELPPGQEGAVFKIRLSDVPTFPQVTYTVRFRERPPDPWALASFAATPAGPVDQSSLRGLGTPATIYLDRTTATGLHAVSMDLFEM
jgi:hypothetical protein